MIQPNYSYASCTEATTFNMEHATAHIEASTSHIDDAEVYITHVQHVQRL